MRAFGVENDVRRYVDVQVHVFVEFDIRRARRPIKDLKGEFVADRVHLE